MELWVQVPVNPTEDPERIRSALTRIFPNTPFQLERKSERTSILEGHVQSVLALRQRIWEERILDAARGYLLHRLRGNRLKFEISKQALIGGKVSFPPRTHTLGEVEVEVLGVEDLEDFIEWLAPTTAEGEIVDLAFAKQARYP